MANICPHCKSLARCRTSERQSPVTRRIVYQCSNVECGHTFVAMEEVIRTISPSAMPDPHVVLPVYQRPGTAAT